MDTVMKMCVAYLDDSDATLYNAYHANILVPQPREMTIEQQKHVLAKTHKLLTDFCGKPPRGSVAPWWETSAEGTNLLLDWGIEYDHSSQAHDSQMFYLRDEDHWTKIGKSFISLGAISSILRIHLLLHRTRRLHTKSRKLDETPGPWQRDRACRDSW